jgi:hypothetical protein
MARTRPTLVNAASDWTVKASLIAMMDLSRRSEPSSPTASSSGLI